jgi:histone-lysine N-methyltransferase SETMAR
LGAFGQFNVPQWIKTGIKFETHHLSRLPHPPYSPDINPCDFLLFELLKGVLKYHQFNSSNEIEEAITKVLDGLTFDEVQSVFHNWMSRLACVTKNREEYIIE